MLTSLLGSSSLFCRDETVGIRSRLRRLPSELLVYDAMFQLDNLPNKKIQVPARYPSPTFS